MLGQTNLLSKPASRIQPLEPIAEANSFVPKYTYGVALALIANAAEHGLRKKLLHSGDFDYPSIEELNKVFAKLVNTVWCDHSGVGGPSVAYAASIWVDKSIPVKPSYAKEVRKVYKDVVNQIDYSATDVAAVVNSWACAGTSSLIKDLVPGSYSHLIDHTTLVFASTLYFQDLFNVSFDPSQTTYKEFHTLDGGSVRVPFMTRKNKIHHLLRVDNGVPVPFSVLSLPYRQGQDTNFAMLIVLPKARDGLPRLLDWIYGKEYKFLHDYYPHRKVQVDNLVLPRFKVSGGDADPKWHFLPGSPPYDLTGMVDASSTGQKFNRSFNFCRWSIDVNEQGATVAGAVADFVKQVSKGGAPSVQKTTTTPAVNAAKWSGSGSDSDSDNNGKFNFVADHPFILFILETKNEVAKHHDVVGFQGSVLNPLNPLK